MTLKIIFFVLSWLTYIAFDIPMMIIGWILIPIAVACGATEYRKSYFFDKTILAFSWKFMYPWGNEEDGIDGGQFFGKNVSLAENIILWSANRNPTNNTRFIPILSLKINPSKVNYIGSFPPSQISLYDTAIPQWFLAWQGPYSSFYWQFKVGHRLYRFWVGWAIYPTDVYGVTPYRKDGAGFKLQFKRIY